MPVQVDAAYHANVLAVRILPTRATTAVRVPYHIALLLDTSGSMEGEPIAAVIRSLHLLIDTMTDNDVITIIQYAAEGTIIAHAVVISSLERERLHGLVNGLVAEGGTNMEAAIETLGTITPMITIDAVFLMTDGHVNVGITRSTGLLRLLSSRLPSGTPVNTLGFGTSHNAEMLRDMAVRSRGSYTYADSTELIPAIIGNIIGGLKDQVGRNAVLTADSGGVCIELGADPDHPEIYRVGPLIADKPQWVLFRGSCSPVHLTWKEGETEYLHVATADSGVLDSMDMEEQLQRVRLVGTMTTVSQMLARRYYDAAIVELTDRARLLSESPAAGRTFIIRLQAQVDEMLEDIRRQHADGSPMNDNGMLTRMVSNVTALGTQHGFFLSRNTTVYDPDIRASLFSTPRQRNITVNMTQRFQDPT